MNQTDLEFLIITAGYFGLLVALGLLVVGFLIGIGTVQKMRGGWAFWDAFKMSAREWT